MLLRVARVPAQVRERQCHFIIQAALETLIEGRTTIAIAHRLSTVRDADEIVVLDHGRIVEEGSHEELLDLGGRYYELYRDWAERAVAA